MKIIFLSLILVLAGFASNAFAQQYPTEERIQTEIKQLELQTPQKQGQSQQPRQTQQPQPSQQQTLPQQQLPIVNSQEIFQKINQLEQGLAAKQKENKHIIQWIIWWWWIGFIIPWIWIFIWIFIGWQWWKLKFWVFNWPQPFWFFIPLLWFVPWVILGIVNWLVWWLPWIWFWWIFPWVFWVPWWFIVYKEKEIWLWRLGKGK